MKRRPNLHKKKNSRSGSHTKRKARSRDNKFDRRSKKYGPIHALLEEENEDHSR